ncbi:MAG TPA: TonB-dependent receptor, partial [Vicinamibacterales bacterium]|nr:TonB-dependent receptor [Vicinamibacterales bacterium]
GIFVQDQWTIDRLTLNLGVRYDHFKGGYPEQVRRPVAFIPDWNLSFPAVVGNSLHDITPRVGAAYDLTGGGRTALKISLGKYPLAVIPVGNPAAVSDTITRSWADRNANFWPDCDLLNLQANGECGTVSNLNFGRPISAVQFNRDLRFGWGHRPWSAEFSVGVQHQLVPRLGVDVGYFRRWYGNFMVTDNRAVGPADFDTFSVTAPRDPRLPSGGGYVIGRLYDLNPVRFGQVDNYQTFAKEYGEQVEYWQGVDVGVNARLQGGALLQGGVSTGRTVTDNCEIRERLPEIGPTNPYCRVVTNFLTQVKLLGAYPIPGIDVQVAATFQSSPGTPIAANRQYSNAEVLSSLGRPLAGGAANTTVNLVPPGTMYGDRVNQLDVRLSRPLRVGRYRLVLNLDVANVLNASPVMQLNNNYAVWLTPQRIMDARIFKVSGQLDF